MKKQFGMSMIVIALSTTLPALAQQAGQTTPPANNDQSQNLAPDQSGGARARNQDYPNGQTPATNAVQAQAPAPDQNGGARARNQDFANNNPNTPATEAIQTQTSAPDQAGGARARNSDFVNGQAVAGNDQSQQQWQSSHPFHKLERADKLLGREVTDAQNQKIGALRDFAVDLHNGRMVEAIIGVGGVLGVDETLYAVPPSQLTCNEEQKTMQLNVDQAKFKAAPSFKMADWQANAGRDRVMAVYQYYGAQPFFVENKAGESKNAQEMEMGQLVMADQLMGSAVHNMQNDRLGKVDDLIVDMRSGRVAEVILATGGFLGVNDVYSAVPPQAFRQQNNGNEALQLDTTKEVLANAPHFKSSEWPDFNNPEQVTAVYRTYDIQPYFATTGAGNSVYRKGMTPLNQGSSQEDVNITRQIRQEIMSEKGLSINAQNIVVITLNGQVTLRGTVNTQGEKNKLGEIAGKFAVNGSVDNQIQVNTTTSSLQ